MGASDSVAQRRKLSLIETKETEIMNKTSEKTAGESKLGRLVRWEKWWGTRFDVGDTVEDECGQKFSIASPHDIQDFRGWWYVDKIWPDGRISHRYVKNGANLKLVPPNGCEVSFGSGEKR